MPSSLWPTPNIAHTDAGSWTDAARLNNRVGLGAATTCITSVAPSADP
ncbi:MAG TPA: hypothetical protein VGJ60_20705 [Chloroflexota bacterium]|jgi:hypothetical protein